MQIGIFAKTFSVQGALPVLQAVRAAGYEAAQFNMACLGLPPMPDEISASDAGLHRQGSRRRRGCPFPPYPPPTT